MLKYCLLIPMFAAAAWAQSSSCNETTGTAVSACINSTPTREFGQPTLPASLNSIAPNLVEGREVYQPYTVAFDTSVTPPILYVVDTANNRILAYNNPYSLTTCGLNNPGCGFANLAVGPDPKDFQTTLPGGPSSNELGLETGLNFPTSAAVDSNGNLYVLDAGNNRILRFPAPFKQTSSLLQVDLVIGQKSFASGNSPNQGLQSPTAQSLYFSNGGTVLNASLTIEPATGALWVTDPGNNRALRFPTSQLAANTALPAADLVVGQSTFTTGSVPTVSANNIAQLMTTSLYQPSGITFDASDRLYISDGENGQFYRVMVYTPGFGIGMASARILGLIFQLSNQTQAPTFPNNYSLIAPVGLFTTGNNLWVCDAGDNRLVEYDVYQNWPTAGTYTPGQPLTAQISPPMLAVLGQTSFTTSKANQGLTQPTSATLSSPFGAAVNGTDIWIADTANNRILDFPQQSGATYTVASRVIGQLNFGYNAPNLIEGREVNFASGLSADNITLGGGGVAVDHNSNPPHLYVADTANNRILCFNDALTVGQSNAVTADMVIGQSGPTDFYHWEYNYPLNDPTTMSQTGLSLPTDVFVDPSGNLWVADFGNGRVLRFPAPFAQPAGTQIQPNLVLGQFSFSGTPETDPSPQTMAGPFGITMFSTGAIAVSDAVMNRVLIFTHAQGADFQSSQAATTVLGQQNFTSVAASNSNSGMYSPRHIAVDTSDRLYVADAGNNRLVVFNGANTAGNGATFQLNLPFFNQPQAVKVSSITGEVWLGDTGNRKLYRLPEFDTLIEESTATTYPVTAQISTQTSPFSMELDDSDNVIIGEQANRVTFYFASLAYQNPANYNSEPLAPGQLALLYRDGLNFNFTETPASSLPLPTTLDNVQIFVNGVAAPIYRVDPIDIAFQVPQEAPSSGTATIVVEQASTGAILGTVTAQMAPFNPGFFTSAATGTGLAAATNQDGSVNSASNPVKAGSGFITFYLTGGGIFPGSQDGAIPSPAVNTTVVPQILSADGCLGICPAADVLYSGSSFFPGVWQINFNVQSFYAPGQHVIAVQMNGDPSNIGPAGTIGSVQVTFYSK